MDAREIIAILGPTAAGKSRFAVELALALADEGEHPLIVSADSIAVYRELPILSGAPSVAEMKGIEHEMIAIRSVADEFSAGEFATIVHPMIDAAVESGRLVIVVGGTGLYIRAALCDLDLRDPVDREIRTRWQERLSREGSIALHSILAKIDPDAAARTAPTDGRRVTRALELLESGQAAPGPSSGLWGSGLRHPTLTLSIERDAAELRARIERRCVEMFERGVEEEVRQAEMLGPSSTSRAAVGWDESLDGDLERMTTRTWQLARRQRTWIRRSPEVSVLPIEGDGVEPAIRRLLDRIAAERHS